MLARQLAGAIQQRWRRRFHGIPIQVPSHVPAQLQGRRVPPRPVFLQGLHRDPVQFAPHQLGQARRLDVAAGRDRGQRLARVAQPRARPRRLLLADPPQDLREGRLEQPDPAQRRRAGQELVEQHTQGVDIAARVDPGSRVARLLGAHVLRRPHQGADAA